MNRGVTLSYDIADKIAIASMVDIRDHLRSSTATALKDCQGDVSKLSEWKLEDYTREAAVLTAIETVINYYGG